MFCFILRIYIEDFKDPFNILEATCQKKIHLLEFNYAYFCPNN